MEEKWIIYSEGPTAANKETGESGKLSVKMHRSWTGKLIYELLVEVLEGTELGTGDENGSGSEKIGGRVTALVWESDEEVIRGQDEGEAKKGAIEVCRWVLGIELDENEQGRC